jgi:hypothetical protein
MVSDKFISAVKNSPRRNYQIAWEAELHPSTLSAIVNGIIMIRPGDPRVLRVGAVLGLTAEECFDSDERVPTQTEGK